MKSDTTAAGGGRELLVFAGTADGRKVSDYLCDRGLPHTVCVATGYGEEVLAPRPSRSVRRGRMDEGQMRRLLAGGGYLAVVDATHPYAVEVSKNIRAACEAENVEYLRLLRGTEGDDRDGDGHVLVHSALEAARYLEGQEGGIFLTTGSKELPVFAREISEKSRLFARVLPSAEVIASCRSLGLEGKQICGMQGPFSQEMNEAMLRQAGSSWLVTKDTGAVGGYPEKLAAAGHLGVRCVIIRRPEEAGCSWEALLEALERIVSAQDRDGAGDSNRMAEAPCGAQDREEALSREISCIGIGMGDAGTLTIAAAKKLLDAQVVFGAGRILKSAQEIRRRLCAVRLRMEAGCPAEPDWVQEYEGKTIAAYLERHPGYRKAAILMSGDVGFYSGARAVAEAFPKGEVRFFCGISSVSCFASRVPTAWQDAKLLSVHGRRLPILNEVQRYRKLILLAGGASDVERICGELADAGMDEVRVTLGTNLSYPEETVRTGFPSDFLRGVEEGLPVLMLENDQACYVPSPGIPDERFVRGDVPMTKEEIRILAVSKLGLTEDAVVYDIGAGTGSVSVECARLCTEGTVYAVEKNPEGIALICENSRRLRVSNVVPVQGTAPEAMEALPAPTHAFIGGSSGNMGAIVQALLRKNPDVCIVISTVTLESISEVMRLLAETGEEDAGIVQVFAARSRRLGRYHLMGALNPVYLISFGGKKR